MANSKTLSYDVRVNYKDGGFESFCVEKQSDSAEAVITVMKLIRRKQRHLGNYKTVENVFVVLASCSVPTN